jgi:hypothetical protein
MTVCIERGRVDRHFEGTITPDGERAMREHLPECDACRAYYERWLLLSRLDPAAPPPETRIARGLGLPGSRSALLPFSIAGAATLVAAAAAILLFVRSGSESIGFTARGGTPRTAVSRVFIYDVQPGKPAAPASASVARGDELAFAYENGAAKERLMIFGLDEHHHVYWFYPAWTSQADNPVAIPIEHDEVRHELPEAVRHDFDGSRLEIRSLFLDRPLSVTQVEAMLRQNPVGPLPIPGAIETPTSFAVAP